MDFLRRHKKIISDVFGLGVLVLSLFVVVFFIWKRCRAEYNGDYTDTLLWANAAVTSGHFYNPDYWYAYFIPFSGIPLMIPIVSAFGLTYFSHQLGMTVFALIFAAALFVFFKALDMPVGEASALSGLTMILMCSSKILRMIFYGHIIHYSLVVVFMCVAFLMLKYSSVFVADGKRAKIMSVIIAVWCMLCCTNGVATIILFFIPFVGSLILERYFDPKPISLASDRKFISGTVLFCAGGLAGFVIKCLFFGSNNYEDSITALLPSDGWVWNQSPFLLEWITVLTDDSGSDVLMMSFDGIRMLCMYVLALVILVIPFFAIISYRRIENRMLRLFIIYYWIMFGTTMLTYSVSYALVSNWRLCGLVCTALMLTLCYTLYMLKKCRYVRWFILIVPVIAICTFIAMLTVKKIPSALNANRNDALIEIYEEHGLTRGYSSFWNSANAVTVLSDNKVHVSPIVFWPDGRYGVRHYQSEPSDYVDIEGCERYFVAVDAEEMGFTKDTLVANSIEQIKYDDNLYILVFDRNVFDNFEPVFSDPYPYDTKGDY
ncbi:MAG: hypothetical protein J5367_07090 [Lachnospiraceae bacterium]|nr:hypothetical protein [Lachnospiraceae bacterium]